MNYLTDEQVEQEIERLRNSPYVALARKEQYVRCQRRQALYSLRHLEKKGKSLAASGITMDMLDANMKQVLKSRGFRWAPSQGAWQRQLTDNAIYAAKIVTGGTE